MENQQIIRQKIYTTLYTNIEKIADIVAAELKGTDFPADMQEKRDSVSEKLYEMWICIKSLPIQFDNVSVNKVTTFEVVQDHLNNMLYILITLICNENVELLQQFYSLFVSITAFFESLEHSSLTPYLSLSESINKKSYLSGKIA